MAGNYNISDYNTVAERIAEFREKYPEGSLQPYGDWKVVEVGGKTFITYTAAAYRTPDDQRPGIGTAWEPFPGPTQFTKDSELMNAETGAWGRAIVAALAADTKKGIATAEDVRNRQSDDQPRQQNNSRPPQPRNKPAKPVDTSTGEVLPPLEDLIAKLDQQGKDTIAEKTKGFPETLSPQAEKTVRKMVAIEQERMAKEANR